MQVDKLEIDLQKLTLRYLTKEGYLIQQREYPSKEQLLQATNQANKNLLRALELKEN